MWSTRASVHSVGGLGRYALEHTLRIGICAPPQEIAVLAKELAERFGDRIVYQNLMVPAYGVEVLEIFDPAVNKWEGVLHVARRPNVQPAQIIAIGDDVNDIPMIRG